MKFNLILLVFLLLFGVNSHAQETRIEIKLDKMPLSAEIVSLCKQGFLVLYQTDEGKSSPFNVFNVTKFNREFEDQWNIDIEIPTRFIIKNRLNDTASNRYFWLSMSITHLRIDVLDLSNGQHTSQVYVLAKHIREIKSTKIIEDNLYILLNYRPSDQSQRDFSTLSTPVRRATMSAFNTGSAYVCINLKTQKKLERCDFERGLLIPDRIQNCKNESQFIAISSFKLMPRSIVQCKLILKNLNADLITIDSMIIGAPDSFFTNNIYGSKTFKNSILLGTYSITPPEQSEIGSNYNGLGFYSLLIDSHALLAPIKLYPFSKLESLKKFYTADAQHNKSTPNKKLSSSYSSSFFMHEPIESDSETIFVTEAFLPIFSKHFNKHGAAIQTFEGFKYTYCLTLCFDKKGQLKWDQTTSLNQNIIYSKISRRLNISLNTKTYQGFYRSKGKLKVITFGKNPYNYEVEMPILNTEDDEVTEFFSNETPWLNEQVLIWGVQNIKTSKNGQREGNIILYIDQLSLSK